MEKKISLFLDSGAFSAWSKGVVTDCLMQYLQPKAAACIIEAQHLCMLMRGVQKQNSIMVTSSLKGAFLTNQSAREELMRLIK